LSFVPEDFDDGLLGEAALQGTFMRVQTRPMLRWEQLEMARSARALNLDLVLTTSERAPLFGPPRVMYLFEHPKHRARRQRVAGATRRQRLVNATTRLVFEISLRRAAHVIVASGATGRDIPSIDNLTVVPSGVSAVFHPDLAGTSRARSRFGAPEGYVLHLGSDDPRENTEIVLQAYAAARGRGLHAPLVLAGRLGQARAKLERLAAELGILDHVLWPGFVPDAELPDLYRGALVYVDPSLFEGFGLQALEAMACGTPVITSNTTSLPEIVGSAGIQLDPNDATAFADALVEVLGDARLRSDLGARARARAEQFTWERTVDDVLAVCRAVIANR
jgi:glycosyltransferase involved in cell wall biosynthesis